MKKPQTHYQRMIEAMSDIQSTVRGARLSREEYDEAKSQLKEIEMLLDIALDPSCDIVERLRMDRLRLR